MVPTPAPFSRLDRGSSVTTLLVYAAGLIVGFVVLAVVALIYLTILNDDNEDNGNKD